MALTLAKELIEARESWVPAGDYAFKIRRPTQMELVRGRNPGEFAARRLDIGLELVRTCVVDWYGVLKRDLFSGGNDQAIAFDREAYAAWIEDRPDLWEPLAEAIAAAVEAHQAGLNATRKT